MSMRHKLESSAAGIRDTVAPAAERVKTTADDVISRIGPSARQLGDRIGAQVADLPDTALRRFDIVPGTRSRRRTVLGFLAGLLLGGLAAYFLDPARGADRREAVRTRLGLGAPEPAAANTQE